MSLNPFVPVNNAADGNVWDQFTFDDFVDSLDQWLEDEVETKTPDKTGTDIISGAWSFTGGVSLNSGTKFKRTAVSAGPYSVLTTDFIVAKTGITGGGDTVDLPAAATAGAGKVYFIVDESGTANTNHITVSTADTALINGSATASILTNYGSIGLYCNGTNWFRLATIDF